MQLSFWKYYKSCSTGFRNIKTCILVDNTSLIIGITNHNHLISFKRTWVLFFIPGSQLLRCKLGNFTFKELYWVILYLYNMKAKYICDTLTDLCEKSRMVSFTSPIMKNIVPPSIRSRYLVKLICCIAFESTSSACYLLKSITIKLLCSLKLV